ncbi:Inner membrane protein YccF [Salmonella enterica subsp. enterica]|uniref:Inner membrane protein YccF n=1 Tax=Salmonella enterica I TaxID=59201 RepID=A0A3S4I1L5_SALET|nr:Inner membrane protein YccF [Salmonella enterica subsp. enterica]
MRTVLNILNFVLGGFATTLAWLLATLVSIVLIFTLPLTRSCWEITKTVPCSLTVMKPFTLTNLIRRQKAY